MTTDNASAPVCDDLLIVTCSAAYTVHKLAYLRPFEIRLEYVSKPISKTQKVIGSESGITESNGEPYSDGFGHRLCPPR